MKVFLARLTGTLLILGTLVAGGWAVINFLFIAGINQIINGFGAHPESVHNIVWGFINAIAFSGLAAIGVIVLAFVWAALFFSYEPPRPKRRLRSVNSDPFQHLR
jgi:hypothetical protein